jgi:hypothetical protein
MELHRQRFALADLSNRTRRTAPPKQTSSRSDVVFRHGRSSFDPPAAMIDPERDGLDG